MTRPIINNSILIIYVMSAALAGAEIFLPGMQPKEAGIEFAKIQQCKMCHGGTKNGEADPFFSWQGGMMAQAAKDPVFRAALAIAEQDVPGVGEYCFRCHTPRGWLEGRSTPSDGSALNREDMQGVSCDVCHRLVDPQSDRARELIEHIPPGYGNAMIVADPRNIVMGPYGDSEGVARPRLIKALCELS
ncbi:MAG: multiheme c-type cytochrome [Planctomycetota bacterium]